jgi:16S rRNA (uracil1498-N3)-methyltransferase
MDLPAIDPLIPLTALLDGWDSKRLLIYGDESGHSPEARELLSTLPTASNALLIGPEGGFSSIELEILRTLPYVKGFSLGPRILRADTASIAALALLQAWCGDWKAKPAFRSQLL